MYTDYLVGICLQTPSTEKICSAFMLKTQKKSGVRIPANFEVVYGLGHTRFHLNVGHEQTRFFETNNLASAGVKVGARLDL